ncbi:MAG: transglycosylase SLT domain-containing protein [Helicobacter sp.]|nr:transglycosylase SLT domain-containing protein [Helicobacter sp.]
MKRFLVACVLLSSLLEANFSRIGYDSHSERVLNSFGISASYMSKLAYRANNKVNEKWDFFLKQFDKGYEFIPTLKNMLVQEGVPQEFLFLAMAESGFSARAYSVKKAAGIWQIMPKTAKMLGLRIDDYIDERRDPIKSTKAAIKYLKYLYAQTGEWYLAAMAYNCGINRLKTAIKRAGTTDIEVLLDEKERYLPLETRRYMRMILEMSLAFNNSEKLQNAQYLLNRGATDSIVGVKLRSGTMLANVASQLGMSLAELRRYNSHFRYDFLPPNGNAVVYIPYTKLSSFYQTYNPNANLSRIFILHQVKKGDTLIKLAKKYNVGVREIKVANKMDKTLLRVKSKIIIPIIKDDYKKLALKKKNI